MILTQKNLFLCKEKSGSMTKYLSMFVEHTAIQYADTQAAKMRKKGQQNGCQTNAVLVL